MPYKHGVYGELMDSKITSAQISESASVYFGLARVNLVRGYAEKRLVNNPVKLINLAQAQTEIGWSRDFSGGFGISEAISTHFDNTKGNIGPIYAVNVLDPDIHRAEEATQQLLTFVGGRASIISDDIIIDTLELIEDVTRTVDVQDGTAVYYADGLDVETVVIKATDSDEPAEIDTDYTLVYADGVLTITVKSGGALAGKSKIAITADQAKREGVDYELSYDYGASTLNVKLKGGRLSASMTASWYDIDTSAITEQTVIGSAADYTGLYSVGRMYQELNVVPSLMAAPGWSEKPAVYAAMMAASQKINEHWYAFVVADIPLEYDEVFEGSAAVAEHTAVFTGAGYDIDTLAVYKNDGSEAAVTTDYTAAYDGEDLVVTLVNGGALYSYSAINISVGQNKKNATRQDAAEWAAEHGYNVEASKVCWGMPVDGVGTEYHFSALVVPEYMRLDAQNNGVPFESVDNITIPAVRVLYDRDNDYFMSNAEANLLCEVGITTAISWGGAIVIWSPHTAAYKYGSAYIDKRAIFDCTIRTLFYILNGFQVRNWHDIGRPMTLRQAQTIMNRENNEYRRMQGIGALLGNVSIQFLESENSRAEMIEGNFVFNFDATVTPPLKSVTLGLAYSDAGFEAYFDLFTGEAA